MDPTQTYLARVQQVFERLLPYWYSPLNSISLFTHGILVVICASCLAAIAGLSVAEEEIVCYSQRDQSVVTEQWLLDLCSQYSGNTYNGQRYNALSYGIFQYYIIFTMVFNLLPFCVRSFFDHRQLQKFLRHKEGNERKAAITYGVLFTGIHSGLRKRKAVVSFVSLHVMIVNACMVLVSSHLTFVNLDNYPFSQFLGESKTHFSHVFPGTAQCEVQPMMNFGAFTDTYGCHFPLSQHYRHMLVTLLIVISISLVFCLFTSVKDALMVFAGPSTGLVQTGCREPELERRIASQWTRDELEALRAIRHKTDMNAFIWILQQLDGSEDLSEVVVDAERQNRRTTNDW